ncbi:VOC family protein [Proteiniclasticum sp. SCR006]|uniref:VOC family protein n=1 Tax=Proteiniclasticum aestuarii TaxID=2817862 RepID=A0A939H9W6_9CLOT|nr:VOC family protein [Proteiniclasticum aestuarii]MBO1264618.1 VOC family protein [Proteiniclasticum aestuarii]
MQKIVPHFWYDKEALDAAQLYISLFEDSKLNGTQILPDTPSGDAMIVDFDLAGMNFNALSGGPFFRLNPSISLMVACRDKEEVDRLHQALREGGQDLMPLDTYPFSPWYAWIEDRYGLSWQLMLTEDYESVPRIRPVLLFAGDALGKAEDFIETSLSLFPHSEKGEVSYYHPEEPHHEKARINYGEITIKGFPLVVMDHGEGGDFTFNEAFSLIVNCKDQAEIDYYWDRLSHVPEAEQCGWLKDQQGISWQIVPEDMNRILFEGTEEEIRRITEAFLKMKKLDLIELDLARIGEEALR